MLHISIQFCKKKHSASDANHCNTVLQSHSLGYSKTPESNATGKDYTRVQLTCPALNHHSLSTTMLITSPAHQFSPNKSKGFEASDCCTSGWTASPGGARAYTHSKSHDQAGIQRLILKKFTCTASDLRFCHTYKIADSLNTC